jgi:hypothetical protein
MQTWYLDLAVVVTTVLLAGNGRRTSASPGLFAVLCAAVATGMTMSVWWALVAAAGCVYVSVSASTQTRMVAQLRYTALGPQGALFAAAAGTHAVTGWATVPIPGLGVSAVDFVIHSAVALLLLLLLVLGLVLAQVKRRPAVRTWARAAYVTKVVCQKCIEVIWGIATQTMSLEAVLAAASSVFGVLSDPAGVLRAKPKLPPLGARTKTGVADACTGTHGDRAATKLAGKVEAVADAGGNTTAEPIQAPGSHGALAAVDGQEPCSQAHPQGAGKPGARKHQKKVSMPANL